MNRQRGRHGVDAVRILQNMIWANALVAENEGSTNKLMFLFPQSRAGVDSTIFHKILNNGRPSPKLFGRGLALGPALLAEERYPGTLKWLWHPIWTVLTSENFSPLWYVYAQMLSLPIKGAAGLITVRNGDVFRSRASTVNQLASLKECGSLNSLTFMILMAHEAFCLCSLKKHAKVLEFAFDSLCEWSAIAWMPTELRDAFVGYIKQTISALEPQPFLPGLAQQFSSAQSFLQLKDDSPSYSSSMKSAWYARSLAEEPFHPSSEYQISAAARSTLDKLALPKLKTGST